MKITFKTRHPATPTAADFDRWSKEDYVGQDPDVSSTTAWWEAEDGALVWKTAWSGFTYTYSPQTGEWEYEGAERGFLRQDLLPPLLQPEIHGSGSLEHVEILRVEGSYGSFEGPQALAAYAERKRSVEAACRSTYEALRITGYLPAGQPGRFAALVWTASQTTDEDEPSGLLEHHPVVKAAYGELAGCLRGQGLSRITLRQFARLVAELRPDYVERLTPFRPAGLQRRIDMSKRR